jgi:molybdate transport system substrate-binding protein
VKTRSVVFAFALILVSATCGFADELTVAVAANVQYPFEELESIFEKETGITVEPVIGSSGKLTVQIENGAPFDIFMSADMDYPDALHEKGLTSNDPAVYGYGRLVIWTMNDLDLSKGINVLTDTSVRKIAVASPKTAPYGRQAVNALKFYGVYDEVLDKLVYGESIAQVNQFISTRAADLGITAISVVLAPNMKDKGKWIEIDKKSYEPIAQGVVILKYAQKHNPEAARKFYEFLFSDEAKMVFRKYGYKLP